MLALIFCPLLLLAPALQGVWDFRVQFILEAAVFMTGGFWLYTQVVSGRPPAFLSGKNILPLICASGFAFLASRLSPVGALIAPEWWNFLAGIFILALASALTPAERGKADLALRLAAWFIVLLGFYQGYRMMAGGAAGAAGPLAALSPVTASLTNANALALFIIMLIPLAAAWKDFALLAALALLLIGTKSVAAVLALLVGACFYAADNIRSAGFRKNRRLLAVLAALAAVALSRLELNSVADRLLWWSSALKMFADRPLLGFGQGAFTFVYPAYHHPEAARMATIYAHNYYLEFLAENGLLAFMFWGWAVLTRLRGVRGAAKYALIAALTHSLVDFGLAVPAIFFVFCYLLGSCGAAAADGGNTVMPAGGGSGPKARDRDMSDPDSPAAVPRKQTAAVLAAVALGCFIAMCGFFASQLKLERLHALALEALRSGDYPRAVSELEAAARLAPKNPLVPELLSRIRTREGSVKQDKGTLFSAAVDLERALILAPYEAGAWRDLGRLYTATGERRLVEGLQKRKAEVFR